MATEALPKTWDFVRQELLRGFKHRVRAWICTWKSGQVSEEGGVWSGARPSQHLPGQVPCRGGKCGGSNVSV